MKKYICKGCKTEVKDSDTKCPKCEKEFKPLGDAGAGAMKHKNTLRDSLQSAYYAAKGLQKQGNQQDKIVGRSLEVKLESAIKMFETLK